MNRNIIFASCKGQKEKHPYQDFIQVVKSDGYLLAALADGLGSSRFSSRGASLICLILAEQFERGFSSGMTFEDILFEAISSWYDKLDVKGINPKDCLTTSSVLFLKKDERKAYLAQIGDSLLAYRCDGKDVVCLSEDKDFLNETDCIGTSKRSNYHIHEIIFENSLDFLIASDGFGDEIMKDNIGGLFDYFISSYSSVRPDRRGKALKKEIVETMQDKNNDDKSVIFGWIR